MRGKAETEAPSTVPAPYSRRQVLKGAVALAAAPLVAQLAGCARAQPRAEAADGVAAGRIALPRRRLGSLEVSALGLGCMNFAWAYGPPTDRQQAIRCGVRRYALSLAWAAGLHTCSVAR